MSATDTGWQFHSNVRAGDSTAWTFTDCDHIYRIVTDDGQLCAPGWPTMCVAGKLMSLKRFAHVEPQPHIRSSPFRTLMHETGEGGG